MKDSNALENTVPDFSLCFRMCIPRSADYIVSIMFCVRFAS